MLYKWNCNFGRITRWCCAMLLNAEICGTIVAPALNRLHLNLRCGQFASDTTFWTLDITAHAVVLLVTHAAAHLRIFICCWQICAHAWFISRINCTWMRPKLNWETFNLVATHSVTARYIFFSCLFSSVLNTKRDVNGWAHRVVAWKQAKSDGCVAHVSISQIPSYY